MNTVDENKCPVCDMVLKIEAIEQHVDDCLKKLEDGDQPTVKKPKFDKSAAWGCLAQSPSISQKKMPNLRARRSNTDTSPVSDTSKSDDNFNFSPVKPKSKNEDIDLFANKPLAEQMRPLTLTDYFGQEELLGDSSLLKSAIENLKIPNMILWGPPGCGKTSLARIIANLCKERKFARFVNFSAASSGIGDVKEVIKSAQSEKIIFQRQTIMFMDEIHRFNKLQQDTFLPHVENGVITLIGATTQNPSFSLNSALLSRCRVFVLEKLSIESVEKILRRATNLLGVECVNASDFETKSSKLELDKVHSKIFIEKGALTTLAKFSDGDARTALNSLQLAVQHIESTNNELNGTSRKLKIIKEKDIKEALLRTHTLYDRDGDEHYNSISALHKSIRGNDANASLYWLARMLTGGEDPLYIARRLIRCASEDIGLADPLALQQAICAYQGCQFIGLPECKVILAQCVVYLARCPKSVEIYRAYSKAEESIKNHQGPLPGVPLHLRNAPTKLMKNLGYGKDYKYNPNYREPVDQLYLPSDMKGTNFFTTH